MPTEQTTRLAAPEAGPGAHTRDTPALEAGLRTRREEAHTRLILDSATAYAIVTLDPGGCVTSWSKGAELIFGYTEAEMLGRSAELLFTAADRRQQRLAADLRLAAETGQARNESWHLRRDGARFWASGYIMPLAGPDGPSHGFLNILCDRTALQAAAERRELLLGEMDHRARNTFATVQALATQTHRHTATIAEFEEMLGARLAALARANSVLNRAEWQDAPLQAVIGSALAAYANEPGRLAINGPPALLAANLAGAVSLMFNELATNATKYGALSTPTGRVAVSWSLKRARSGASKIEILWREHGGPAVSPPTRSGFGTYLLEKAMPPGGTVTLDFQPDGLECRLRLPPGA